MYDHQILEPFWTKRKPSKILARCGDVITHKRFLSLKIETNIISIFKKELDQDKECI